MHLSSLSLLRVCVAATPPCSIYSGQSVGQWWCSTEGLGLANLSAHHTATISGARLVHSHLSVSDWYEDVMGDVDSDFNGLKLHFLDFNFILLTSC